MIAKLVKLFEKYREVCVYIFFGGLATLVNFAVYYFCDWVLGFTPTISEIWAQIISIIFAFFTNKFFVFLSKNMSVKLVLKEFFMFGFCRAGALMLSILLVYIFIEQLGFNDFLIKALVSIIVVILNYIFSKYFIFRRSQK